MSEINLAALLGGVVLGIALYWFRTTPRVMRRAAALLIREAARVEAAREAARVEGDHVYRSVCKQLGLEETSCAATHSEAIVGPVATDEI